MIPVIPWYLTLIALATNTTIAVAVWSILSAAARRTGLPPVTQRRVRFGTALFLGAWLGAALLLAPAPASLLARDRFYLSPLIPLFVVVPPAIALLALWRSPALQRVLGTASLPALIGVQLYRVMGAVFLVLLALGQLPAHFALPAGWGDIAIGVGAPLVAIALAAASGADAPGLGAHVPPAAAMGVFPMIVVPAFAVPMSILLHLLALGRLLRGSAPIRAGGEDGGMSRISSLLHRRR